MHHSTHGIHKKILLLASISTLTIGGASEAQVYQCEENGKAVFSDRPCVGASTRIITVRPASGDYDPSAAKETERRTADSVAGETVRRRREAQADQMRSGQAAPAELSECQKMKRDFEQAKERASWMVHPENVRREKEKAKELASKSYVKCSSSERISVFDMD